MTPPTEHMTQTDRSIKELELAGLFDKDSDYEGMIGEAVKELLIVFQKQGHSGFSASYVAGIFNRLVNGETLTPLNGTPNEWQEVENGDEKMFQNIRNSAVFAKTNQGEGAYYLDGKVFIDKNGTSYTSKDSLVNITFPCFPKTEFINDKDKEAKSSPTNQKQDQE